MCCRTALPRVLEDADIFALHRRGLTRVEYAKRDLDDVNVAIGQVLDGSAPAPRLVFRMQPAGPGSADGRALAGVGTP